MFTILYAHTSL